MIVKFGLLLLFLVVGCIFASALLLRLSRAAERLAVLQKELAENDKKLKEKMDELNRQRIAVEAKAEVRSMNDE